MASDLRLISDHACAVGGLRADMSEREIEDEFRRFGKIYKARR